MTDGGFIEPDSAPPDLDAAGYCGNAIIELTDERPNLYFVMDHSGSMTQKVNDMRLSDAAHDAVFNVLDLIGHHVRYGATVFPNPDVGECAAGVEIFKTRPGDLPSADRAAVSLLRLMSEFQKAGVRGGTPIASTFQTLSPTLLKLPGKTYVILLTDGGPNCNSEGNCEASECQLNIEGVTISGFECNEDFNCCDPDFALGAQLNCVDEDESVSRVAALRAKGIDTFVVGLPGSEYYRGTLNKLAVAGGRPRVGAERYFSADTPVELSDALIEIGLSVAISCEYELAEPPPDKQQVNVYFDRRLVVQNPESGWVWLSDTKIQLVGDECRELRSGQVKQVQIVSGCPTEVR